MRTCHLTIAAALLLSLPAFAFADNDAVRRDSTTMHREGASTIHRSEQGEVNANDPSSSHRALGRERAEERHEMKDQRENGMGGTKGEEEHHTLKRDTRRLRDEGGKMERRMDTERHESSTER